MLERAKGAACAAFFAGILAAAPAGAAGRADDLFRQGDFAAARAAYEAVPPSSPEYEVALRQLGAIALYQNHLGDAEAKLHAAIAKNPADREALGFLAEAERREGKYPDVVKLLTQLGRPERAAEFALFGDARPYRIANATKTITVPFERSDPLPLVLVKVNGKEGIFIIDTGAAEVVIDPGYAQYAGVPVTTGGSGGKSAAFNFGRIAKLVISSAEIDDVPAMVVPTAGFRSATLGKRIAGVIGTEFLSHFRSTLDFPGGKLVLEPSGSQTRPSDIIAETPFWLLGDHFIIAAGSLNDSRQMFAIQTGLSGFAFTVPASTLQAAGIKVPPPPPSMPNAKGQIAVEQVSAKKLVLGDFGETDVTGLFGPFPAPFENMLGVRVGGIVTHSFFRPYAITFDFVQMRMAIRKSG